MFQSRWANNSKTNRYTYASWNGLVQRCTNPDHPQYSAYGGRGIQVCERWRDNYDAFVEDMGHREKGMTIERIDVNGNYEKQNCCWLPKRKQVLNTRRTLRLTYNGQQKTLAEWSEFLGLPYSRVFARYKAGMTAEEILSKGSLVQQPKHGTISCYVSRKCRCDDCRKANSDYVRARRLKNPEEHARKRREKYHLKKQEYDL